MLTRLWSEAFKEGENPREAITFRPGLNTIRGGKGAENSIGKSTLLYIIDYAFGGSSFLKTDTLKAKAVGHHRICFTFEFNGHPHHFARLTDEPGFVHRYSDETYQNQLDRIELDEFKGWLKRNYQLADCDSSFREIVSRFFRIKQGATAHADHPLQGHSREPVTTGLSVLYQLFGLYEQIRDLQAAFIQSEEDWKAVKRTRDLDAFPVHVLRTKKDYEKALKDEKRLTEEYEANIKGADQEAIDFQAAQLNKAATLKAYLQNLRSQRSRINSKITQLKANLDDRAGQGVEQADIQALTEFFPGINLATLEEAQRFHHKITQILTTEIIEQIRGLEDKATALQRSINEAQYQLRRTGVPAEISRERLDRSAKISTQREIVRQQARGYEQVKSFQEAKKQAELNLNQGRASINSHVIERINPTIAELDLQVHDGEDDWDAPALIFSATGKSYEYKSDTDGGDGTTNKNLILFDLAMLHLTDLPAVIHDSPLHKNIADERVEQILRLYMDFNSTGKQIFIAFDKDTQYEGTQVHELIMASKVVEIGDGDHALYGWTWNKTRKDKKK
ncbi:hypothetical protein BSR28_08630 [Boudabousia liubingyangii]|uniref:DUF2326 domain-containing protein n=1 Tax=Boudabousia liubingyangii TaxID=1921764 RepID=UPI00093DA9C2|nr:DUF2326 domain-containing protein [Boudabousia liubingyangii]OKL45930.1 hypothetical protein BSR28_08630 [Boudabousia liubingyangii]